MTSPSPRCAALAGLLLSGLLAGCAGSPVKESDRDTSGQFDGAWYAQVKEPVSRRQQMPGNWYSICEWQPFDVRMLVDDGYIKVSGQQARTPISEQGRFRLEVPMGGEVRQIGGVLPGSGKITLVLSGRLGADGGVGEYMRAVALHGNQGCRAKVDYRAVAAS